MQVLLDVGQDHSDDGVIQEREEEDEQNRCQSQ